MAEICDNCRGTTAVNYFCAAENRLLCRACANKDPARVVIPVEDYVCGFLDARRAELQAESLSCVRDINFLDNVVKEDLPALEGKSPDPAFKARLASLEKKSHEALATLRNDRRPKLQAAEAQLSKLSRDAEGSPCQVLKQLRLPAAVPPPSTLSLERIAGELRELRQFQLRGEEHSHPHESAAEIESCVGAFKTKVNATVKMGIQDLQREQTAANEKTKKAEGEARTVKDEIKDKNEELKEAKRNLQGIKEYIAAKQGVRQALDDDIVRKDHLLHDDLERKSNVVAEGIEHIEYDQEKLKAESERIEVHVAKKTAELNQLGKQAEAEKDKAAQQHNLLILETGKCVKARSELSGLVAAKAVKETELVEATEQCKRKVKEKDQIEERISKGEAKIGKLKAEIENIRGEKDQLEEARRECKGLTVQINTKRGEMGKLMERIKKLQEAAVNAESASRVLSAKKDRLDGECKDLEKTKEDLDKLAAQRDLIAKEKQTLKASISELKTRCEGLNSRNVELFEKNNVMKQEVTAAEARKAGLDKEITTSELRLAGLKGQIQSTEKKQEGLTDKIEQLKNEFNSLTNTMTKARDSVAAFKDHVTQLCTVTLAGSIAKFQYLTKSLGRAVEEHCNYKRAALLSIAHDFAQKNSSRMEAERNFACRTEECKIVEKRRDNARSELSQAKTELEQLSQLKQTLQQDIATTERLKKNMRSYQTCFEDKLIPGMEAGKAKFDAMLQRVDEASASCRARLEKLTSVIQRQTGSVRKGQETLALLKGETVAEETRKEQKLSELKKKFMELAQVLRSSVTNCRMEIEKMKSEFVEQMGEEKKKLKVGTRDGREKSKTLSDEITREKAEKEQLESEVKELGEKKQCADMNNELQIARDEQIKSGAAIMDKRNAFMELGAKFAEPTAKYEKEQKKNVSSLEQPDSPKLKGKEVTADTGIVAAKELPREESEVADERNDDTTEGKSASEVFPSKNDIVRSSYGKCEETTRTAQSVHNGETTGENYPANKEDDDNDKQVKGYPENESKPQVPVPADESAEKANASVSNIKGQVAAQVHDVTAPRPEPADVPQKSSASEDESNEDDLLPHQNEHNSEQVSPLEETKDRTGPAAEAPEKKEEGAQKQKTLEEEDKAALIVAKKEECAKELNVPRCDWCREVGAKATTTLQAGAVPIALPPAAASISQSQPTMESSYVMPVSGLEHDKPQKKRGDLRYYEYQGFQQHNQPD